jgi:hypothetical protein
LKSPPETKIKPNKASGNKNKKINILMKENSRRRNKNMTVTFLKLVGMSFGLMITSWQRKIVRVLVM